jgi:hypothetical protein
MRVGQEFVFISVAEALATAASETAAAGQGHVVEGPKIDARDTIPGSCQQ